MVAAGSAPPPYFSISAPYYKGVCALKLLLMKSSGTTGSLPYSVSWTDVDAASGS